MSEQFGAVYSGIYDAQYHDKDYAQECDLIERFFQVYHPDQPVKTVLDMGCGTGNHALPLAGRGYAVAGVDRSAGMLAAARSKAAAAGLNAEFHEGDVRTFALGRQFDAVLMMFAVLGYQLTNEDAMAALKNVRAHLKPGGAFVFDVWYGPAVLHLRPSERVRVISTPDVQLIRVARGSLDTRQQRCTVSYHLWQLAGEAVVAQTQEAHDMRYFFPLELEFLLQSAGLRLVHLSPFPAFEGEPGETTWNVIGVATASS
jgi:SAM-dependent methyltransferase